MSTADAFAPGNVDSIDRKRRGRSLWSPALQLALVAQAERVVGLGVAFTSRWFLGPVELGIYSGLRLLLDNTNRSSFGVALGAIQKSIALRARCDQAESDRILAVAATTNTLTSSIYGVMLFFWGLHTWVIAGDPRWGVGLMIVGALAVLKRRQDFRIAVLRSYSDFTTVGRVNLLQNLAFGLSASFGILLFGFWGLLVALVFSFLVQGELLKRSGRLLSFPVHWNLRESLSLAAIGLPILAANTAWAMVTTLDRALILANFPNGAKMAGYFSIAVLGCGILEDFASRVAIVLAPGYRNDFGKGVSIDSLLARAEATGLGLLVISIPFGCILAAVGKTTLIALFPNLAPGADALAPLIPGTIALCASMPLREAWISADRPWIPTMIAAIGAGMMMVRIRSLSSDATLAAIALESSTCRIASFMAMFALPVMVLKWSRERAFRWAAAGGWTFYWVWAFRMLRSIEPNLGGLLQSIGIVIPGLIFAAIVHRAFFEWKDEGADELP
ncbi:hypothetical protein GC170_06740 [bacterium]|nr:hypothetical protein [bacterium]